MGQDLLGKWMSWWQPLRGGLTAWGLANGLPLTGGWFWARVRGGYLLYRGAASRANVDWTRPVGAAGYDATEVWEFPWAPAVAGRTWYAVRAIGGGGLEAPARGWFACGVDEAGRLLGPLPGDVERAWAAPAGQGRIRLWWQYGGAYEGAAPEEFRIYHDHGTGQIDRAEPAGVAPFDMRRSWYTWLSGPYGDGTRVGFEVCAANGAGEGGPAAAAAVADDETAVWPAVLRIESGTPA